jgi:hypothetical protein
MNYYGARRRPKRNDLPLTVQKTKVFCTPQQTAFKVLRARGARRPRVRAARPAHVRQTGVPLAPSTGSAEHGDGRRSDSGRKGQAAHAYLLRWTPPAARSRDTAGLSRNWCTMIASGIAVIRDLEANCPLTRSIDISTERAAHHAAFLRCRLRPRSAAPTLALRPRVLGLI